MVDGWIIMEIISSGLSRLCIYEMFCEMCFVVVVLNERGDFNEFMVI
jgi:hypothetical protein